MPLARSLPKIDNRTYDDIVAEIRARIPRYAPEWTDLNESDPGMTFIELFAWLAEMLIFRLGKVPELNYLKFLELLGIELMPAEPARAEITFPVKQTHGAPYVTVPSLTQLQAEEEDEDGPIIFETDRAIHAIRSALSSVLVSAGSSYTDCTTDNQEPERGFRPFGASAGVGSALLLGFTEELPQVQIDLGVWSAEEESGPEYVRCGTPSTAVYPSAEISWEFWAGTEWKSVAILKDETLAFTRSGHIVLKAPGAGEANVAQIGPVQEGRYWLRARVACTCYEKSPRIMAIRTNTVSATQAQTIRREVVGGSSGAPNQTFRLSASPVLAESLRLVINEGEGRVDWTERPDFLGSSPKSRHFVLNRTTGEILFGDGSNGAIPVANVDNASASIVADEYRFGGGQRGNVTAGNVNSLLTSVAGIDEDKLSNLFAAHSGRNEETLEQAKERAQRSLKSRCRAVTAEDFETLAAQAADIRRAKALPLAHPDFPNVKVPVVVTVIVVPVADESSRNPTPSKGTLRTVCAYLDQRRLLTTEVYVAKPTYRHVEITGQVIAGNSRDLAEVATTIEKSLLAYLHPLTGGEDGQGWPFGGDLYYSRVYQRVFSVPGVDRIQQLSIVVDGQPYDPCTDVSLDPGVLVYSTSHSRIEVNYDLVTA